MKDGICGIGVIGCGTFSDAYLSTLGPKFKNCTPVSCADLNEDAAKNAAAKWNIPKICTSEEMFEDPDVDIVLILTNPASHYPLTMDALRHGKNVYCEKPLADSFEKAAEITALAAEKGLFVGAAPDTFLTSEFQTVRKLIADGRLGRITGATANFYSPGPEYWHPNASFLFKKGGGPVLDIAPYYLTVLVSLLGPIEGLYCVANKAFNTRIVNGGDCGVDVFTNYCGVLKFASGAVGNINMTYDRWKTMLPGLEIYGTEGVVYAPDPNTMMGPIRYLNAEKFKAAVAGQGDIGGKLAMIYSPMSDALFEEVETIAPRGGNIRGAGVSDMADAIINNTKPRVSAELCLHITEAINAFDISAGNGAEYQMTTACGIPEALLR